MASQNLKLSLFLRRGFFFQIRKILKLYFSPRWGPELLAAFDLSEISKREERQEKRSDNREKVPDIKEPDVKVTKDNACSIM